MSKHANLRLTAKLLPIIAPFIAKNDIRYYLNAINVRPHKDGGAVICATNGHVLGAIYDKDAVCEHEVTLRFDVRMQQACAAGLKNNREVVMLGERLAVVENGATEVCIQAGNPVIEGLPYPRYERVIPKAETLQPGLIGMFGAPLIALAEKAAIIAGRMGEKQSRGYSGMQFFSVKDASNASVVFRTPAAPEFVGVMMPMRDDYNLPAAPTWVASLPPVDDLASMAKTATAPAESAEVAS
jgi:hypothetical protein